MAADDVYPPRDLPGRADNWGRRVETDQKELYKRLDALEQTIGNQGRSNAGTNTVLARQILALPITAVTGDQRTNFGLSAGWNTYLTVQFQIPDGKTRAKIMATGGAAAVDLTTGGLTTSYGRIQIGSSTSVQYAAAKDAGTTAVNNILTMSHSNDIVGVAGDLINVILQLQPLNAAAFSASPGNYASLNAIAVFSN